MEIRRIILLAFFIALSYMGAAVKILGTIAFDSMPAFLAALLLGPAAGAVVGAAGHFFTAALSGFPLTLPVHVLIMGEMALAAAAVGWIYRRLREQPRTKRVAGMAAVVAGCLINGPLSLLLLYPWLLPLMGRTALLAYLPVLTTAALLNIGLAFGLFQVLPGFVKVKWAGRQQL
ncbi:ECF transporter S component [Propionispora vibrioides]|uniref:ECF transporter S component n=1 Tax=Propionispora vibrioides TaxID=112903 RepID=A0A1H8VN97_9FIRM|nr:ECF transporter S component [Propionispora vibrioides]SEP16770.1 Protein of unknown function [Propionispora vibrioides]